MSQSDQIQTAKSSAETSFCGSVPDDETSQLKIKLRQVDNEYKKTKAVLEQRITQLEQQISEYTERESNLKKMNESMMSAITEIGCKNDTSIINKAVKELEVATDQHNKEMQEYRNRTIEQVKGLEFENNKLKQINSENEGLIKELKLQFEKNQLSFNSKLNELENEKATLEIAIKRLEEEKRQSKDLMGYEVQLKLNEIKSQNEKLKEDHRKETEKMSADYDKNLQDMKNIFNDEKRLLETRIEKMSAMIREQTEIDTNAIVGELQAHHKNEIEEFEKLISELKFNHLKELDEVRKQRDDAFDKVNKAESNLQKLRVALRNAQSIQEQNSKIVKQKIDKAKCVMEQGENLVEENKKYKQKVIELKAQVKKLEASEKKLKDLILDKEIKIDDDRIEFKKLLTSEQKFLAQSISDTSTMAQSRFLQKSTTTIQNPVDEPDFLNHELLSKSISMNPMIQSVKSSQIGLGRDDRSLTPTKGINSSFSHNTSKYGAPTHHTPSKSLVLESITPQQLNKPSEKSYMSRNGSMDREYSSGPRQTFVPLETSFAEGEKSFNEEKHKKSAPIVPLVPIQDVDKSPFLEKKPKKVIDIDSIPITYQEYIKKSERSRKTESTEGNDNNSRINIEQILATAAAAVQNVEQPQFGTSHFLLSEQNEQIHKSGKHYRPEETQESEPDHDYEETIPNGFLDFKKKNSIGMVNSIGMANVRSNALRDELDRHPSLINPLSSVQEYDIRDSFEGQFSIDGASSKNKSSRRSLATHFQSVNEEKRANPTESRQRIEERLKGLESKLREMELKNQGLKVEKDKVQIEFEKLMLELRQAKADTSALDNDQKSEKENALKNEIKFLINKLLKVKNKLEKQSEELNHSKVQNNTSTCLTHSQIINQSINIPPSLSASNNYYGGFTSNDRPKTPTGLDRSYTSQSGYTPANNVSYNSYMDNDSTPKKTSLGAAIENFAKNVRSKSNLRYEGTGATTKGQSQNVPPTNPMNPMNTSISSSVQLLQQQISQRAKTPMMDRNDLKGSQSGSGRDVLRDSLNQYSNYSNPVRKSYK